MSSWIALNIEHHTKHIKENQAVMLIGWLWSTVSKCPGMQNFESDCLNILLTLGFLKCSYHGNQSCTYVQFWWMHAYGNTKKLFCNMSIAPFRLFGGTHLEIHYFQTTFIVCACVCVFNIYAALLRVIWMFPEGIHL